MSLGFHGRPMVASQSMTLLSAGDSTSPRLYGRDVYPGDYPQLPSRWTYVIHDPLAVEVAVYSGGDHPMVWTIGRALVAEAAQLSRGGLAGDPNGDVQFRMPVDPDPDYVFFDLHGSVKREAGDDQWRRIRLLTPLSPLRRFVAESLVLMPVASESQYCSEALDMELNKIVTERDS